jgi:hypothetical protein
MNPILKTVLQVGESIAVQAVPGARLVDAGAHAIFDKTDRDGGVLNVAEGAIQVVESIKEADIADEVMFKDGVADLEAGFKKIHDSLKHKDGTPAPVQS